MFAASSQSQPSHKQQHKKKGSLSLSESFRPENLLPGLVIGFLLGFFLDLSGPLKKQNVRRRNLLPGKRREQCLVSGGVSDLELKMVLVVRQDLKMGQGKIASQCAHAATGMYAELMQSDRFLLKNWEQCGQPKIVCTCKNQQEMIRLMEAAENIGLPTFVVSDAGRTQVAAGSRTVLAVGPGMLLHSIQHSSNVALAYKMIYVFNMLDYVLEIKISIRAKRAGGFSNRAVAAALTSSEHGYAHYAMLQQLRCALTEIFSSNGNQTPKSGSSWQ